MRELGNANLRPWIWFSGITLLTTLCVWGLLVIAPWNTIVGDFICYYSAGTLAATGKNPYDVALQTEIQRRLGWDKATDGLGKYDFLPYYYPPWFAQACALLVPLQYHGAKIAWFFLNLELLFLAGYLLRDAVPGLPQVIPLVSVPVFALSVISLFVGQTAIAMLFLVAVAWKLLERGHDRAAGVVLALLTTKPQLAAILVVALLLWSVRRGRIQVVQGFVLALAVLTLAGALLEPWWPIEMLRASQRTEPPTAHFPWIGTTLFLVLKTLGVKSWGLWGLYLLAAVPFLALVVHVAVDRSRPLEDVLAVGLLACFIVAPYGRHYDFPVLLIPLFVLMARRLPELAGSMLLVALLLLPYLHLGALIRFKEKYPSNVRLFPECTFFWIPLLLTLVWLATEIWTFRGQRARISGARAARNAQPEPAAR
jgi:hypothetical protein